MPHDSMITGANAGIEFFIIMLTMALNIHTKIILYTILIMATIQKAI